MMWITPAGRQKQSDRRKGKTHSDETKAGFRAVRSTPEYRSQQRANRLAYLQKGDTQ